MATITWTGNLGPGPSGQRDYGRTCDAELAGKPPIAASSDPAYRGEADGGETAGKFCRVD